MAALQPKGWTFCYQDLGNTPCSLRGQFTERQDHQVWGRILLQGKTSVQMFSILADGFNS